METHRYSLYQLENRHEATLVSGINSSRLTPALYSRFKYGCVESTICLADRMFTLIEPFMREGKDLAVTSSAYFNVPTAAAHLLHVMLKRHFGIYRYSHVHLRRDHIFPFDYACLQPAQREQSMSKIRLDFDARELCGKTLLVIDDAYVSGAHERTIIRHLYGIPSRIIFFYLMDLSSSISSTVEHVANGADIKSLTDLLPLISHPDFTINSRALKMILSARPDDFSSFFSFLSDARRAFIYAMAIAEGYESFGSAFKENLAHAQQTLTRRSVA